MFSAAAARAPSETMESQIRRAFWLGAASRASPYAI